MVKRNEDAYQLLTIESEHYRDPSQKIRKLPSNCRNSTLDHFLFYNSKKMLNVTFMYPQN